MDKPQSASGFDSRPDYITNQLRMKRNYLSVSALKAFAKSPNHYLAYVSEGGRKQTPAMLLGAVLIIVAGLALLLLERRASQLRLAPAATSA